MADRSQGAAHAVFEAGFTGGAVLVSKNPAAKGVPRQIYPTGDPESVRIYAPAKNESYCGSGWHVVDHNVAEPVETWGSRQALFDFLDTVQIRFVLDGVPLVTRRTAIKRLPNEPALALEIFGWEEAFWFGEGALVPPGTLTEGKHRLEMTIDDDVYPRYKTNVQFTILPC